MMEPGRELDALVAEKVMGLSLGYTFVKHYFGGRYLATEWSETLFDGVPIEAECPPDALSNHDWQYRSIKPIEDKLSIMTGYRRYIPQYSTDIKDAWEVVEKMQSLGCGFSISTSEVEQWFASFKAITQGGQTAPHAICLAALRAIGTL